MSGIQPVTITPESIIAGSNRILGSLLTRPNDTNAYTSGDLIANDTTAGSVTPGTFTAARANDKPLTILRAGIFKSSNTVSLSQFHLHLFNVQPTVTNGDNGVFSISNNWASIGVTCGYLGKFYIDMNNGPTFATLAIGIGAPATGSALIALPGSGTQTLWYLIEAMNAYVPTAQETFKPWLELVQD